MKYFICDVDGCLNDGKIYWAAEGKPFKVFGNYDHDGLKLLKPHLEIRFITADESGWEISKSRIVDHMKFQLFLVKEQDRFKWVEGLGFHQLAYMGDGLHDAPILRKAAIGIAPAQARPEARESADLVTQSKGGEGAVMDACLYILDRMKISYGS